MNQQITMPSIQIGNIKTDIPVIQGGMGVGVSLSGLASAVAEQGGIGVIAAAGIGMMEPDYQKDVKKANEQALRREIRQAKVSTSGVIGVNIMVALSDYETLLLTAVDEGADIVFMGAGLPLKVPGILTPERMNKEALNIVPIVSSARAADLILKSWSRKGCFPAALVVEGPEAGGHLGFKRKELEDPEFDLAHLVPQVIRTVARYEEQHHVSIPVIAAGGIYTGADIKSYLDIGAAGVQMATRFVTTEECDAAPIFKQSYIEAERKDMVIIDSPVGLPGRAVQNRFLCDVAKGQKKPFKCSWKCLRTCNFKQVSYCIASALTNAKLGKLDMGFVFGGVNAYRAKAITTVKEVFDSLYTEYEEAVAAAGAL